MSTASAIDTFRLDLPASWQQVPTDPDMLRSMVREQRESESWRDMTKTDRRRLEMYVERFIADLGAANASIAALYSERLDAQGADSATGEVDEDEPGMLIASCTVSIMHKEQLGSSLSLTADVVLAALSLDKVDADATTTVANLEPPMIVGLTVGAAVRAVRLVSTRVSVADTLKLFTETFYIPIPDDFDALVVAQFATPNVADAVDFSELFGELANTVRFYREDEPTEL